MKVSIIIKALNEEQSIQRAIRSSLKALENIDGEVILADCLSDDKTVTLASKYPIRIVQLKHKRDRGYGMGAELGYRYAKGEFIYILDADMKLSSTFIPKAIDYLNNNLDVAGVGGIIKEKVTTSLIFSRRANSSTARKVDSIIHESSLMMGGLYRKKYVDQTGYFAHKHLHAYEESDLGLRLAYKGYRLVRIPEHMVDHYGDDTNSFSVMWSRWKSRYLWGAGELLRLHVANVKVYWEFKIYLAVIIWWLGAIVALFLHVLWLALAVFAFAIILVLAAKKKSIVQVAFSLFSWHITAIGLVLGFLFEAGDPNAKVEVSVIQ